MTDYLKYRPIKNIPRLPLTGNIDITYRCNNHCRHCWLRISCNASAKHQESPLEEIIRLVDEARAMGCRHWRISGGEPMLRIDFVEIFDYMTTKASGYTLNTNGTLITPSIAKRMKRKGTKLVALYGATPEVHDHITRTSGSFDACMQGMAYLKEAGAGFTVQIVPMRDNFHQYEDMIQLAQILSPHWRIGSPWLYLSASGNPDTNREIMRQRLSPGEVAKLEPPTACHEDAWQENHHTALSTNSVNHLFADCIANRRDFHADPYNTLSFCGYIIDPAFRYPFGKGNFSQFWEAFMPDLMNKVPEAAENSGNCQTCNLKNNCSWCPAFAFLEHRRFSARIDYLCDIAQEKNKLMESKKNDFRYYQIAGITVQLESDLPLTDSTFDPKFKQFEIDGLKEEVVRIRHRYSMNGLDLDQLGEKFYHRPPWAIYRKKDFWIYTGISADTNDDSIHQVVVCSQDHTRNVIYHLDETVLRKGHLGSLSLMPTDQIILSRVLADRQGCYLHASGVSLNNLGLLFAGHSGAGKTTAVSFLQHHAEILCDDRMIVRRWPEGFRIHGTWSHGDIKTVSAQSAPLKAILFLNQSEDHRLELINDKRIASRFLLEVLIKPLVTASWWDQMLALIENMVREIPCYNMYFKKDGRFMDLLEKL